MSTDEFLNKSTQATKYLTALASEVILKESPVSFNTISARIMDACGITKSNPKIRERIDYVIRATRIKPAPDGKNVFFWKPGDDPMSYDFYRLPDEGGVRDPDDIHSGEAACAIREALIEQYGMPEEEALIAGARKLGLMRMTPAVKELMTNGMTILHDDNVVTLNGNGMLTAK
ncbi:MAG: DUF3320 domain-containing protein [Clostridiales bacterium]|nr:DUF3320 domain-containing protein [Clostridiales bacterium]